jgi:hypothetical protein
MVFIYILKLSNNKYYIGKTTNPKFRLNDHFNNYGSVWTSKFKPIKVLEVIKNCDDYDEDKYTLKYMGKYGINNVRGGTFCEIKLTDENKNTINKMINGSTDKCYTCGKKGHFTSNCKHKEKTYSDSNLSSEEESDLSSEEESDSWMCSYCGKIFGSYKGAQFHEKNHCKKKQSKTYYEESESESDDNYKSSNCYNCGRKGHYSTNCYASKHIKGYYL